MLPGPKRGECAVSFSVRRADVNRFSDVAAAFSANLLLAVQKSADTDEPGKSADTDEPLRGPG